MTNFLLNLSGSLRRNLGSYLCQSPSAWIYIKKGYTSLWQTPLVSPLPTYLSPLNKKEVGNQSSQGNPGAKRLYLLSHHDLVLMKMFVIRASSAISMFLGLPPLFMNPLPSNLVIESSSLLAWACLMFQSGLTRSISPRICRG